MLVGGIGPKPRKGLARNTEMSVAFAVESGDLKKKKNPLVCIECSRES